MEVLRKDLVDVHDTLRSLIPRECPPFNDYSPGKTDSKEFDDRISLIVKRPIAPKHTVGLEDQVQQIMKRLESMETNILGIVGMGGIGTFLRGKHKAKDYDTAIVENVD